MSSEKPWWQSQKIWIAVAAILGVLGLFLGGAAIGLTEEARAQAVEAIKWIVGFLLGSHALSDAAHSIGTRAPTTSSVIVNDGQGAGGPSPGTPPLDTPQND